MLRFVTVGLMLLVHISEVRGDAKYGVKCDSVNPSAWCVLLYLLAALGGKGQGERSATLPNKKHEVVLVALV